VIVTLKKRKK